MKILKSREDYQKLSKEFNNYSNCRLCDLKKEHIIKKYKNWTWVFAEFPYYKYHTMIVPRSHTIRFYELKKEELLELESIVEDVENLYKEKGIISDKSLYGKELLIFWRSRYWAPEKKFVEHLHIHICPEHGHDWDSILDKNANEINMDIFKCPK